jgi:hypothetical protein
MFKKFLVQNGGRGLPFFWPDGTTGFLRKYQEKHSRFFLFSSLVAVLRLLGGASPLSFGTSRLFYKKIFFIFIFKKKIFSHRPIFSQVFIQRFFLLHQNFWLV